MKIQVKARVLERLGRTSGFGGIWGVEKGLCFCAYEMWLMNRNMSPHRVSLAGTKIFSMVS